MKYLCVCSLFLLCAIAVAQDSDLFTKAPPDVDEALRARIDIFYQAFVTGKFHQALKVVAEDSLDAFMAEPKDQYKSCEIAKINYKEHFTEAEAVVACKTEYRWHNQHMPVTLPLNSSWKLVDGVWYKYEAKPEYVESPWGILHIDPKKTEDSQTPSIPADPLAMARDILRKVSIDKTDVLLKGYEDSVDEVHVVNNMPGVIRLNISFPPTQGVTIKADKPELQAGERATIVFAFNLDDAKALCHACFKPVKPSVTADIRVDPTNQVFPVKVEFAIPPELQKLVPAQQPPSKQ